MTGCLGSYRKLSIIPRQWKWRRTLVRFLAAEGTGFGGWHGGGGALVAHVRRTSERDRRLVCLGPFGRLRPTPPHEVSGVPSTSEMRERRPGQAGAMTRPAELQSQKRTEAPAWPAWPAPRRGCRPTPGPLRLLHHRVNREDGSLKVPRRRHRARGPVGGPGGILPTPRKLLSAA